jgi:hypothetical protein
MIIKSFLPNPVGKDTEGEEIVLLNNENQPTSLKGWYIEDAAGKKYFLSGVLSSQEEIVLPYSKTKIPLNNNGETIFLYNSSAVLVDKLIYIGQAVEGKQITREDSIGGIYGREEIFENFPEINGVLYNRIGLPSLFLIMIIVASALALVGNYAYKKLYPNQKSRS